MLTLLDLSSAFDSVDHDTLLQRLRPRSIRPHINGLLYTSSRSVWSTAGIGPRSDPIPSVHLIIIIFISQLNIK